VIATEFAVSSIQIDSEVRCNFFGVDGSVIVIEPLTWEPVSVGPPQRINGGYCDLSPRNDQAT
jgi:hypothetical protein